VSLLVEWAIMGPFDEPDSHVKRLKDEKEDSFVIRGMIHALHEG